MRIEDIWSISIEFQSTLLLYSSIPSAVSVLGMLPPPRSNDNSRTLGQEKISLCLLGDRGTDFSLERWDSKPDFPPAETTIGSIITAESTCAPHQTGATAIYQHRDFPSIVSDNTVFIDYSRPHPESPDKFQLSPTVVDWIVRSRR
ncbi:hypothetical protein C8J56DRAFT_1019651 [Mycena floridula]|nr:hypothetical protein C8J56DRAFT_1019651 [Mycena floridula]